MAGVVGTLMALLYWYAQGRIIYPEIQDAGQVFQNSSDVVSGTTDSAEQREKSVENLGDQCSYLISVLCDMQKNVDNSQFLLQETQDGYELTLYDTETQEVFSMIYPKEPWIEEVSEGILEIGISVGSPARYTFYFRKEDGKISDTFFNAKLFGGQYIAHRPWSDDQWDQPLILTDIFGEGILYQEIYRDFSETADLMSAISSIELVDEDYIILEYFEGEEYTVVREVVEIEGIGFDSEPEREEPYALAYYAFLEEYARESDYVKEGWARFALAFIDDNEIPELLLMEDDCHARGVKVFTFDQGSVVELGEFGSFGRMQYVERGGMIFSHFMGQGATDTDFYRVEEGKAELICSMHSSPPLSYNGFTDKYEIDGCSVDEQTYQTRWQELYEDQEYVLITYEDGIPIKEEELKCSLSEAIDQK